ncbi:MAG TPA: M13 family metallopeptidase [Caulobacter sp.]|nr:M13 family metallopeptidase [Caulobacter sp.]
MGKGITWTRREAIRRASGACVGLALPGQLRAAPPSAPRPGDDFYQYADAAEIAAMVIPPDRWDYGQTDVVGDRVTDQVRALVTAAARRTMPRSPEEARVATTYRALLDEATIQRIGLAALKQDLAAIARARSPQDLAVLMADPRSSSLIAFNVFPVQGAWMAYLDTQNHNQPALGLPTWTYAAQDANATASREAYARFITDVFALTDIDDGARRASDIIAVETQIAARLWPMERIRDRRANLHVITVPELEAFAPGLPWRAMLKARGLDGIERLNLGTDSAVAALAQLFSETPLETWRGWLAFSWVRNGMDVAPDPLRAAQWRFVAGASGRPRPSREVEATEFAKRRLPMEIGRLYTEAHVPRGTREEVDVLLGYLKRAMAERLRGADWLDAASRAEALAKLDAMGMKAVAPRAWPSWPGAPLRPDDAVGNLDKLLRRDWAMQHARLTSAEARTEVWYQAPQIVDASYSVLFNKIEVPAAILQAPYFSTNAHPAANFGAIGAIVGHEMGHGFNDQGILYDSKGVLRDWVSTRSQAAFATRAARLAEQYGAFEPLPGLKLNGRRTLGENIADLSGVSLSLRAYQLYRVDHPDPASDERDALRVFFLSWAKIWAYKAPESAIRHIVANSYYPPAPYRVNGVVRNLDAWYGAFDVQPGDALYLPPEDRVRLW